MTSDAIIILSGGVAADGSLPGWVRSRVERGVTLWRNGIAPRIIMSGRWGFGERGSPPITEAQAMKRLAVRLGVPAKDTRTEEQSRDTIGNAYFTQTTLLVRRGWTRLVVVTSDYHLARTRYVFQKILGPKYVCRFVAAPSGLSPRAKRERVVIERALLALTKHWLDRIPDGTTAYFAAFLACQHPGYSRLPEAAEQSLTHFLHRAPRHRAALAWHLRFLARRMTKAPFRLAPEDAPSFTNGKRPGARTMSAATAAGAPGSARAGGRSRPARTRR